MKFILPILLISTCAIAASPATAPTGTQMAEWAAFDRPVTLERSQVGDGDFLKWGDCEWAFAYQSPTQTLYSYVVALYKGGSLFGTNRLATEKRIETGVQKLLAISAEDHNTAITERADGRKAFCSLLMYGPGGALYVGFVQSPDREHDIAVFQIGNAEDDMPDNERLKSPSTPHTELPRLLENVEAHLFKN